MDNKPITLPLPPPPPLADACPHKDLTPNQIELQKKVLDHFSKPDYVLPGEEKGELMEEEKFWLVRSFLLMFH
jgi:hypothetical protein